MFATKIMFYLLLLCGTVLCDAELSYMERLLAQRNGASTTATTVRPLLKGCDLGSKEGSNGQPGACVKESLCQRKEKKGRSEATTVDPATSFVPRDMDSATLPFDVEEIDLDNPGCNGYLEVCCILSNVLLEPKPKAEVKPTGCGFSNPGANTFRGTLDLATFAEFAEFPWMVALIKIDTTAWSYNDYVGGGSIIHPSVVVTAAHKVDLLAATEIKCRGGEWDTQSTNKSRYPFQDRNVNRILLHPKFFKTSLYYAAALLILESPFQFSNAPHIGTACLNSDPTPIDGECFTMGWDMNPYERTTILKKIKLSIVSSDTCERQLKTTRLGPFFKLHKSLTCAGREDLDACQGDSGSALVCPIKTNGDHVRYAMVGIVAYRIGCGKVKVPGVYVKVSEIYPWINQVMTDEGYGTDTYRI